MVMDELQSEWSTESGGAVAREAVSVTAQRVSCGSLRECAHEEGRRRHAANSWCFRILHRLHIMKNLGGEIGARVKCVRATQEEIELSQAIHPAPLIWA